MRQLAQVRSVRTFLIKRFEEAKLAVRISRDVDIASMAQSLAFTTVLSIAPLIAVLFAVFQLFGGLDLAYKRVLPTLLEFLSEGTGHVVAEHLKQFVLKVRTKTVGWAGFAGLLITASLTYFNVAKCFARIFKTKESAIRTRVLRIFLLLTIGPVLLFASLSLTALLTTQLRFLPHGSVIFAVFLNYLLFLLLYTLVPTSRSRFKAILSGAFLPAIALELAKTGYAIYTSKVITYSAFYGSFAVIPLFLIWVFICWYLSLFGAAFVKSIELQTPAQGAK